MFNAIAGLVTYLIASPILGKSGAYGLDELLFRRLSERGIDVSYETVRPRALIFGRAYAARLRKSCSRSDARWHLDEVFVTINGKRMYLWRAVDREGEVLDILVQSRRNKKAALKLIRKLLKKQGFVYDAIVTDKLPSYGAALTDPGLSRHHDFGGRKNNRAENSHLPVRQRERRIQRSLRHIGRGTTTTAMPARTSCG